MFTKYEHGKLFPTEGHLHARLTKITGNECLENALWKYKNIMIKMILQERFHPIAMNALILTNDLYVYKYQSKDMFEPKLCHIIQRG